MFRCPENPQSENTDPEAKHVRARYSSREGVSNGFSSGPVVKNPPANAGDTSSVPGLGRSPGGGHGTPLQYPPGKVPRTEEPGGLQSVGAQRVRHD